MGRQIPFDTMQSMGELLPRMLATLEGKDLEAVTTSTGKLMYKTRSEIVEPTDAAGQSFFDNFVIGSDADPAAEEKATWNGFGGKRFRSMMEASGVEMSPKDDEELASEWAGQRYMAFITVRTQAERNKDGSENPYAGNQSNEAKAYYAIGEREAALLDDGEAPSRAARKAAPTPKLAAAGAGAKAPATKVVVAPKGNGVTKPAAKAAQASRTMKCTMCGEDVPVSGFPQHVEDAHPE